MRRFVAFPALLTIYLIGGQPTPEAQVSRRTTQGGVPAEAAAVARNRGFVRVIVELDVPFLPEMTLGAARAAAQRSSIANAQANVLRRLARANAARIRQFTSVPYLALQVDEADLQSLATAPEVLSIGIDGLLAPTLAQSASLIGAPAAWSAGYTGAGWTIAVLDTGVDKTHPFLGGKVVSEACYSTTADGVSTSVCPGGAQTSTAPNSGMPCTMSECVHGTHVAGIAAGSGSTFSGVAKGASIIAIQVFSSTTECAGDPAPCARAYESDLIAGLERVYTLRTTYNIAAANLSLGGGLFTAPCDSSSSKAIIDQLRAADIATVISSGNSGSVSGISEPACVSTAISVGSTTDGSSGHPPDQVSSFTNRSPYLTLLAPGQTITSSVPGTSFSSFNGTSMAAPHVAGAWAILKSRRPSATVTEVTDALISTAVGIVDSGSGLTMPRIRLDAAVQSLQEPCSYTVTPMSVYSPRSGGTVTLTVTTRNDCQWSSSTSKSFVAVNPTTGQGPASVSVTVDANPLLTGRQAGVLLAGTVVTLNQAGATAGDVNGDGWADLVWQDIAGGSLAMWYLEGPKVVATVRPSMDRVTDLNWRVVGSGDLNGDGSSDLVWQHQTAGSLAVWFLSGTQVIGTEQLSIAAVPDTNWQVRGVGDTNGDGFADLIWRHKIEGWLAVWFMIGSQVVGTDSLSVSRVADTNWQIAGAGDIDADGKADIIWQNDANGGLAAWLMDGSQVGAQQQLSIPAVSNLDWKVCGVGDATGDGYADLLWQNLASGDIGLWQLSGFDVVATSKLTLGVGAGSNWRMAGPG